ncbi:TlpA family protein disulfide reductase [Jatrophihabitans sp.]|uniref:TlpA family protein disulfide reductase n=1 Tax=Jatrophihabitans sp. TaxID=1932789 RepID=UPI002C227E74|nr:TlpA disulfide reductase family protein [Jatrophihabitans sp.]
MTVTAVLTAYAALVASLALAISLLALRVLPDQAPLSRPGAGVPLPAGGPDPGSPAPPILARTSTGQPLDSAELAGRPYLVAFLSSSCPGCRTSLPSLAGYVGLHPGPLRLIVVIVGDPRRGADIERLLAPIATVVFEPVGGPIAAAYRITGFPSYVLVSADSAVLATGGSVLDLPQSQPQ